LRYYPGRRAKTMISTMVRTLSRVPISLRSLAVCVACEECFELGDPTCPSCGSDEYVPLLHQLEGRILNMTSNN
jgi:rRNA maturation endonuclease Nob1